MRIIILTILTFLIGCKNDKSTNQKEPLSVQVDFATAKEFYDKAKSKLEYNDHRGAIKDYQEAVKINPKYYRAYMDLGNSQEEIGLIDRAVASYFTASNIDGITSKQKSYALLSEGEAYLLYNRTDMNEVACDCFSRAAAIHSDNKTAKMRILLKCQ